MGCRIVIHHFQGLIRTYCQHMGLILAAFLINDHRLTGLAKGPIAQAVSNKHNHILQSTLCIGNQLLAEDRDVVLLSALWISMHVNDRRAGQFSLELDYTGERGQVHRVIGFFGRVSLFDSGFTNRYQKATEDKGSRRHALQLSASRDWNLFAWDS